MSWKRLLRRKARPSGEYGCEVRQFLLPRDGLIQYAQWLHPFESPKPVTQDALDGVRRFVSTGDFVIDIGAHTGDTTLPLAMAAGANGCALALEPNPYVFKVLAKNASLNRDRTKIVARCFAATEQDGQFVFHYSDAGFCNGGLTTGRRWPFHRRLHPLTVQGRNLLTVLRSEFANWLPKLSYVKVDAEGHDRAILASILPVLRESRPVIRAEVFRGLSAVERFALHQFFTDLGYRVHRYAEGAGPPGPRLEHGDMTRAKHFDILAMPRELALPAAA
jgi:FkbM family methyltransferase